MAVEIQLEEVERLLTEIICFVLILQHSTLWYPWGSLNSAMVQKI